MPGVDRLNDRARNTLLIPRQSEDDGDERGHGSREARILHEQSARAIPPTEVLPLNHIIVIQRPIVGAGPTDRNAHFDLETVVFPQRRRILDESLHFLENRRHDGGVIQEIIDVLEKAEVASQSLATAETGRAEPGLGRLIDRDTSLETIPQTANVRNHCVLRSWLFVSEKNNVQTTSLDT